MQRMVVNGDLCVCNNGSTPCRILVVNPLRKMKIDEQRVVVETDVSIANISSFGMCNNINNPAVAAATAAAQGVLTPAPCVPVLASIWDSPVKKTFIDGDAVVGDNSTLDCMYGGCVHISYATCQKSKSE